MRYLASKLEQSRIILTVSAILILTPQSAYAYVDPGSGSVIVTTVLGVLAAIGYTMRKYFYKLRGLFRKGDADLDSED